MMEMVVITGAIRRAKAPAKYCHYEQTNTHIINTILLLLSMVESYCSEYCNTVTGHKKVISADDVLTARCREDEPFIWL